MPLKPVKLNRQVKRDCSKVLIGSLILVPFEGYSFRPNCAYRKGLEDTDPVVRLFLKANRNFSSVYNDNEEGYMYRFLRRIPFFLKKCLQRRPQ